MADEALPMTTAALKKEIEVLRAEIAELRAAGADVKEAKSLLGRINAIEAIIRERDNAPPPPLPPPAPKKQGVLPWLD